MVLIETQIVIHAPREKVWEALADFPRYHLWNPFCSKLETGGEVGDPVVMWVHLKPGKKPIIQKEILRDFAEGVKMDWGLNWGVFLKAYRTQRLTSVSDEETLYYTSDQFQGWLTPVVMALYRKDIQRGFEQTAQGLKSFVESSGKKILNE